MGKFCFFFFLLFMQVSFAQLTNDTIVGSLQSSVSNTLTDRFHVGAVGNDSSKTNYNSKNTLATPHFDLKEKLDLKMEKDIYKR